MPELRRLFFLRPNIPSFREMLCPLPLSQMERASLECLQQPPGMSGSIKLLARGCQGFRPQQAARSPQNLVQPRIIHLEAMTDRDKPDQKHSVQWLPREANLA